MPDDAFRSVIISVTIKVSGSIIPGLEFQAMGAIMENIKWTKVEKGILKIKYWYLPRQNHKDDG
jgi:hypothetical protein